MLGLITYLGVLAVSDPNIIGQLKQTRIPISISNNHSNEQIITMITIVCVHVIIQTGHTHYRQDTPIIDRTHPL